MNTNSEFLAKCLSEKGIRPSYQRISVLACLYSEGKHPTADEVFRQLSSSIPTLSKTTVYNTLHTFVETGLIRVLNIDEAETRYDIVVTSHGHFMCTACGTIYNFPASIEDLPIDGLDQFQITEKNVYFKGLCPNCLSHLPKGKKESV